jgi:Protein of unknown function/AsmA-like C-terminal region
LLRLGIEVVGGLVAATVLIAVVAGWRLSQGPIRTDFITPYLQAAINEGSTSTIELGGTFVLWDKETRRLELHAADIALRDADGKLIASLPEVAFGLSSVAMLQGTLAPRQVELIGPRIRLLRSADGAVSFGEAATVEQPGEAPATEQGRGEDFVIRSLIGELLEQPSPGNTLSFLDELRIRDGQIFVRDEMNGLSWAAPAADISLRRDVAGLAGDISLSFTGQRDPATFDAAFLFDKDAEVIDLAAGFSDISLANLAAAFPVLAPVGGLTSRITGSISTSLSLDRALGNTTFDLRGFAGTLTIPGVEMQPLPVRDLVMRGRYASAESRFDLEEARISLGSAAKPGPVFSIAGIFDHDPAGGGWSIAADATLEEVPLEDLPVYWPPGVAVDARNWVVENVTGGRADKATAALKVTVPEGDFSAAKVDSFTGTLAYRDLVVHYLNPLPPVREIAGTGWFDSDSLHFNVASGRLEDLVVGESTVDIVNFQAAAGSKTEFEQLSIDAKVTGPVHDVLAILEMPRLDLLTRMGVTAVGSGGTVAGDVAFQFPLSKKLSFDHVSMQVEATVKDGALKAALLDQDLTDGRLTVSLDQGSMRIAGDAKLGGVPLSARVQESFAESVKVRSVWEAEIPEIDDAGRGRFGLDMGDMVQGPMAASVSMVVRDDRPSTLLVSADLEDSTITLPEIYWQKKPGTAGSLSVTIEMDDQGPIFYRDAVLQAGDLVARGTAKPGPGRRALGSMDLEHVAFGRTNLRDVQVVLDDRGTDVKIGSGVLDGEPFFGNDEASDATAESASPPAQSAAEEPRVFEPLSVKAPNLRILYFAEERNLQQVALELQRGPAGWESIRLSGSIPEQYWSPREAEAEAEVTPAAADPAMPQVAAAELDRRYIQFSFAADASGRGKRLLAQSDDLGAVLRATNIADTVVGGRIRITGHSDGPSPTYPITAQVAARDFVMVKAPALAKLLTVASFTGVLDLLGGEGIGFHGMDGEFVLDDGVATTELMRIYGAALGLTAKGQIDFDADAIDLTGVVVPAYSINNFLAKIPLLGTLLTGGEGEGLFAVVYSIKGEVDDPEVSVNPLSALTPGFLRNIFTSGQPGDEPPSALPERRERIDK